jgi:sortase A
MKKRIVNRVIASSEAQAKAKQHLHSLAFGLVTGVIVLFVFLFGFFNEMFIAPFVQPSRHVSATPIIVSADSVAPSATPEVIIPKINVQIPVVYDEKSVDEAAIQRALERGIIHYPSTVLPGQQGNASFFGHSSNNIFNKGKYKFAFVLLHELVPGDIFYLTYETKVYTYRVFDKKVVPPSEISVLNNVPGKTATATLITCDPPGTSTNRLVVWGEQISPDPSGAAAPVTPPATATDTIPTELPSEGPTMWSRFWNWLF